MTTFLKRKVRSLEPVPHRLKLKAVASVQIVSAPGAKVTEKVFKLSREADAQLRICVEVPPAAAHAE